MNYKKIEKENYNLHLIKTENIKTIDVRFIYRRKVIKKEITLAELLSAALSRDTKEYNTHNKMIKKSTSLYGVNRGIHKNLYGNHLLFNFDMNFINDKYLDEKITKEVLLYLKEIIYNPNTVDGKFKEKNYDFLYKAVSNSIKNKYNNLQRKAFYKLIESMYPNHYLSYDPSGYKEDLENITNEKLYDFYKELINNSLLDIYIAGEIDFDYFEKIIDELFEFKNPKYSMPMLEYYKEIEDKPVEIMKKEDINQMKLLISLIFNDTTKRERNYILNIYNKILGGLTNSLLKLKVREENSLCYSISSAPYTFDGYIIIQSGINSSNYEKTLSLIKEVLEDIKKGNFSDELFESAKKTQMNLLSIVKESNRKQIGLYLLKGYYDLEYDLDKRMKLFENITKEEVINLAFKIKMDTIYGIRGEE